MTDAQGVGSTPAGTPRRGLTDALILVGIAAAYVAAAKFGLSQALVNASASAVWPPTGLAIGALVVLGLRFAPAVFVGAFLANLDNSGHWPSAATIAVGNGLEAVLGAYAIRRWCDGPAAFGRLKTTFGFFLVGAAAPLVSASIGVASLVAFDLAPAAAARPIWVTWWLGDVAGAIVLAPVVILLLAPRLGSRLVRLREMGFNLGLTAIIGVLVFGPPSGTLFPVRPYSYFALPTLIWAAVRLGPVATALAALLLDSIAIWGTLGGHGPFGTDHVDNEALLALQSFLVVVALMTLPTAALSQQRMAAESSLRRAAATLEQTVQERTLALRKSLRGIAEAELATGRGSWDWDLATDRAVWSEGMYRLFGLDPATFVNSNENFLAMVHPDDRERMGQAITAALAAPGPFLQEYRLTRPDGRLIHIRGEGNVSQDATGKATRLHGVVVDVTAQRAAQDERARLEAAVAASETRLRTIFTNSPVGIILTRTDGTVVDLNPGAETLWGRTRADFLDPRFRMEQLYADPGERAKLVADLQRKGGGQGVEVRMRRGDGQVRRMSFSVQVIDFEGAKTFLASGVDVTEVRESEERFRLLFEANPVAVVIAQVDGTGFVEVNPAFERLVAYSGAELTGPGFDLATLSTDPPRLAKLLAKLRSKGGADGLEIDLLRKGGEVRSAVASVRILDLGGQPRLLAAMQDVTDQKAAQAEVRRAQERFVRIFESSPVAIALTREDGALVDANPAFEALTGYSRADLLAPGFDVRTFYEDLEERQRFLVGLRATGIVRDAEFSLRRKDGATVHALITLEFVDLGGQTTILSILQDVTERKRQQSEREARIATEAELERLRRTDQFRTEFINSTAHELRTPLTPMLLQLSVLLHDAALNEKQHKAVESVQRNAERLRHLIDDMLGAADLQARTLTLEKRRLNLNRELQAAIASHHAAAVRGGIELADPENTGETVAADPQRLQLVLGHLLGNAVKFTNRGGRVWIATRRDGDKVRISVNDTGIGMTARQMEGLWKPFAQAHDKSQRTDSGSGLGLYVTKGIIELHGGEVGCSSAGPGKGSSFWFTLPLATGHVDPLAKAADAGEPTAPEPRRNLNAGVAPDE